MKRALLAAAAALTLSACAEDLGYGPSFGGDMVYYDSYYGPFYNGYWGPDGVFWYSPGRGRPYVRDDSHHFRRDNPGGPFHPERTHPGWVRHHGPGGTQPGEHHTHPPDRR